MKLTFSESILTFPLKILKYTQMSKHNHFHPDIEKGNPEELCSVTNPRVRIEPRPEPLHSCDLELEVGAGDHGTWTCLMALTQTRDVHTVVTRLALSVIVTPVLR